MMPNNAAGSSGSAAGGGAKKGAGAHKDSTDDAPHIEAYQLPRWDAQGKQIPDPRATEPDTSTMEDVHPDSLKPPTADEIRQIHEDAYNEGFESGFEQGMKQGQATGQIEGYKAGYDSGEQEGLKAGNKAGMLAAQQAEGERISAELAPLAELLTQIKAVLGQQTEGLETGLVALAARIARNVIDAELKLNPVHIQSLVHAAVQALPNADERFTLEINPEDAAYVEHIAEPHWNLVPTPSVSRGGCLIRTRFSYVDYSLEHRYRQQVSNLLAHAGLTEHLAQMEAPWPLPPAEPDATASIEQGPQVDDASPGGPESEDSETPASGEAGAIDSVADASEIDVSEAQTSESVQPETEQSEADQQASEDQAPEADELLDSELHNPGHDDPPSEEAPEPDGNTAHEETPATDEPAESLAAQHPDDTGAGNLDSVEPKDKDDSEPEPSPDAPDAPDTSGQDR